MDFKIVFLVRQIALSSALFSLRILKITQCCTSVLPPTDPTNIFKFLSGCLASVPAFETCRVSIASNVNTPLMLQYQEKFLNTVYSDKKTGTIKLKYFAEYNLRMFRCIYECIYLKSWN